jgi:signal transduction histidine kinase/HAMP domain-containing protein
MRGGLGRTLLTAFLALAIVPLGTVSWYAARRERRDIQREVTAKLSSVATIMEEQVRQWTEGRLSSLGLMAGMPSVRESAAALVSDVGHGDGQHPLEGAQADFGELSPADDPTARDTLRSQLDALLGQDQAFRALAFLDLEGRILVSAGAGGGQIDLASLPLEALLREGPGVNVSSLDPSHMGGREDVMSGIVLKQQVTSFEDEPLGMLVGWLDSEALSSQLHVSEGLGDEGEVYLVDRSGIALPQERAGMDAIPRRSTGIEAALSGEQRRGLYQNYAGVPVIGVYRWIPDLELALVAEQPQEEAFAVTEAVTAAIVGASLLVALTTAIIAAVVTRQITRPVVRLTESAVSIAEGDLAQHVPITSRDEIGILAYVFNHMASELKGLYDDLEAKVAQRTRMLQKANYQIQRRAIHLAATVEVSQAATSILEPAELLQQVVRLVHDRFDYSYVGVYLLDDDEKGWRSSPEDQRLCLREGTGGGEVIEAIKAQPVSLQGMGDLDGVPPTDPCGEPAENGDALSGSAVPNLIGRAVRQAMLTGEPYVMSWDATCAKATFSSSYIRTEAALPLRMGEQTIGVLDILNTETDTLDEDTISVLQNVANQITIALENARIYEKEKETARRLRRTETFRSRFLTHMSHELREPLTNIIGFSRLLLKGLDGPMNDQQRQDLQIIHANSQHLLGLINDLLDVSQIEAGMMELHFQSFDLSDTIESVMATTSALVRGKDIELRQEIDDLPLVKADVARIRQVLLKLLTNAAKFTEQGSITVRAWTDDHQVLVSVSDTGKGISPEDQQRVFDRFEQGRLGNGRRPNGAGLGLALSKEFVEMHGGEIWLESAVGEGATFTFSLPLDG